MKKLIILPVLLLNIGGYSQDNDDPFKYQTFYISPGVQVGYCWGQGLTWSTEISIGVLNLDEPIYHLSVSLGYQHLPKELGSLTYINTNTGIYFGGISVGKSLFKIEETSISKWRWGFYTGLGFGFVQYENIRVPQNNIPLHVSGLWGKLPLPINEKGKIGEW